MGLLRRCVGNCMCESTARNIVTQKQVCTAKRRPRVSSGERAKLCLPREFRILVILGFRGSLGVQKRCDSGAVEGQVCGSEIRLGVWRRRDQVSPRFMQGDPSSQRFRSMASDGRCSQTPRDLGFARRSRSHKHNEGCSSEQCELSRAIPARHTEGLFCWMMERLAARDGPTDRSTDRPTPDRPTDRPTNWSTGRAAARPSDSPTDRQPVRQPERPNDRPIRVLNHCRGQFADSSALGGRTGTRTTSGDVHTRWHDGAANAEA